MGTPEAKARGTENARPTPAQRGTAAATDDANAAQRASVAASKTPPALNAGKIGMQAAQEAGSAAAEYLTKGLSFGKLLSKLHLKDILISGALYAVKELSLPPDDLIRFAFADGYAAAMAAVAYRGNADAIESIGWGDPYIDAFNDGKAAALKEIAASPPMSEGAMYENVFTGKARSLNLKPGQTANTATIKRKQRYG